MQKILEKSIKEVMTTPVISVSEDETLKNVFKLMDKHGILGVPVTGKDKEVVGIVTESDLIKHFTTLDTPIAVSILGSLVYLDDLGDWSKNLKNHCAEQVKDLMSQEVITIMESQSLQEGIEKMTEYNVSRLPVVNEKGELSGIITRTNIVKQLAKLKTV